jgi:hypothetical protein
VTGAVAMLRALDPQASMVEIKGALLGGVDLLPSLAGKTITGGRLNLAKSLALVADDYYRVQLAAGETVSLRTTTPLWHATDTLNQLDPALEVFDASGQRVAADDNSGGDGRNALVWFTATTAGSYTIRVRAASPGAGEYTLSLAKVVGTQVVGRHLFYNGSKFDGENVTANAADDGAIAIGKTALLPGQTSSFANYSSYNRGLNGIMVDLAGLSSGASLSASDFEFKVGNSSTTSGWAPLAVAPTVSVRSGAGLAGSSRVTLTWPTGAAIRQWLQVTVKANANTGLATPDVFYFGSAVGESGNVPEDFSVSITDELLARNNPVSVIPGAAITNRFDYNRDGTVSVIDQLLARNNLTTVATKLQVISPPNVGLQAQALFAPVQPLIQSDNQLVRSHSDSLRLASDGEDERIPLFRLDASTVDQLFATTASFSSARLPVRRQVAGSGQNPKIC